MCMEEWESDSSGEKELVTFFLLVMLRLFEIVASLLGMNDEFFEGEGEMWQEQTCGEMKIWLGEEKLRLKLLYAGKFGLKLDINEVWETSSNYKILDICIGQVIEKILVKTLVGFESEIRAR